MKKQFSKAFFILFSLLMLLACSKDDKSPAEPELKKIIVYKNQTGDPNAAFRTGVLTRSLINN